MSKTAAIAAFIFGAAAGSAATWFICKKKQEQIIEERVQEQVESIKESFSNRYTSTKSSEETDISEDEEEAVISLAEAAKEKPSIMEYAAKLQKEGYTKYGNAEEAAEPKEMTLEERSKMRPTIISPEEFGEYDDYDEVSCTYFEDGILVDDNDDVIHNVDETVGIESLEHFGDYEDDSVHVRNDRLKIDYEILRDVRTYREFLEQNPYKAEV